MTRLPALIAGVAAAALLAVPAGAEAAPKYPVVTDTTRALAEGSLASPSVSPPGSNVRGCTPKPGQVPVVLLHGTAQNQMSAWQYLAPTLANQGRCVYSLTYGVTSWSATFGALGKREKSAHEVAKLVDRVLAQTGASKVDLVGYSQGSAVAQLFTQLPGRAAQTRRLIGLGPSNKGISKVGALTDRLPARAPGENDWGPLHSDIEYTMVMTRYDEVASPYTNGHLPRRSNVTNILFQDLCRQSKVGHLGLPYDRAVGQVVSARLDGRTPMAAKLACSPGYPL